uniref:Uncharacterized protein n=1 Tax=Anguilla anguilla TaxID=7936 RepID=A0A0E9PSG9_ANGAN
MFNIATYIPRDFFEKIRFESHSGAVMHLSRVKPC